MAKISLKSLGLLALPLFASASIQAQTVTDPVGVVKIEIAAAAVDQPTFSFLSTSMSQEVTYQGVVSAGGTGTITISSDDWTVSQFNGVPHYALVASGPREGEILDIASNTINTLTLSGGPASENQSDLAGQTISIHKNNTIASIFGTDPALGTVAKGTAETADQLLLYNSATSSYDTYYFNTEQHNLPPQVAPQFHIGWVNAADRATDASNRSIFPDDGFIYKRVLTSSFSVTVSGSVLVSKIKVPVIEGFNLITIPYPVDKSITLATSGLSSHFIAGTATTADQLLIFNSTTGSFSTYYYNNESHNLPPQVAPPFHQGWVNAADRATDAQTTPIPAGSALFVLRRIGNAPFEWVFQDITQ